MVRVLRLSHSLEDLPSDAANIETIKFWYHGHGAPNLSLAISSTPQAPSGPTCDLRPDLAIDWMRATRRTPTRAYRRYNGGAKQRIITTNPENYLSGFWASCAGIGHHNGWMGGLSDACLPQNAWVLSSDQINQYRAQRGVVNYTTGSGGLSISSSAKWTINAGFYSEYSDWACAGLLHYNRELSLAEVEQVEEWLDGLYKVVPAPLAVLGERNVALVRIARDVDKETDTSSWCGCRA